MRLFDQHDDRGISRSSKRIDEDRLQFRYSFVRITIPIIVSFSGTFVESAHFLNSALMQLKATTNEASEDTMSENIHPSSEAID